MDSSAERDAALMMLTCHDGDDRCGCMTGAVSELLAAHSCGDPAEVTRLMDALHDVVMHCATHHRGWDWGAYMEAILRAGLRP